MKAGMNMLWPWLLSAIGEKVFKGVELGNVAKPHSPTLP